MKNKNMAKLMLTAWLLSLASGSVLAADDQKPAKDTPVKSGAEQVTGFGSGTGIGVGGEYGNPNSVNNAAATHGDGRGSETFGGGFTRQRSENSGPLSSNPNGGTGSSPTMKAPSTYNNMSSPMTGATRTR